MIRKITRTVLVTASVIILASQSAFAASLSQLNVIDKTGALDVPGNGRVQKVTGYRLENGKIVDDGEVAAMTLREYSDYCVHNVPVEIFESFSKDGGKVFIVTQQELNGYSGGNNYTAMYFFAPKEIYLTKPAETLTHEMYHYVYDRIRGKWTDQMNNDFEQIKKIWTSDNLWSDVKSNYKGSEMAREIFSRGAESYYTEMLGLEHHADPRSDSYEYWTKNHYPELYPLYQSFYAEVARIIREEMSQS